MNHWIEFVDKDHARYHAYYLTVSGALGRDIHVRKWPPEASEERYADFMDALDTKVCDRARLARDARFDGRFFIAVVSTGIYCRPICPSPTARRENVRYYRTAEEAVEAYALAFDLDVPQAPPAVQQHHKPVDVCMLPDEPPIEPAGFIILTIGIVVSELLPQRFIAH